MSDSLRLGEPLSVRPTLSERRLSACLAPELGILGEKKSLFLLLGWESFLQGAGAKEQNRTQTSVLVWCSSVAAVHANALFEHFASKTATFGSNNWDARMNDSGELVQSVQQ